MQRLAHSILRAVLLVLLKSAGKKLKIGCCSRNIHTPCQPPWLALIAGLSGTDWALPREGLADITGQHLSGQRDHGNLIWMLLVLQRTLAGVTSP